MNGANDGASTSRQHFEQMYALEASWAVQAGCGLIEEHNRRIADELQSNGEALLLSARQIACERVAVFAQAECE